ncbi:MAG: response regulator transcription factor [Permianibacter sp.]
MITLLLIEDHPLLQQQAASLLQAAFADITVIGFADAESALAYCQHHHVDVVVTDLSLPGISGMALLERLHRQQPLLPVIVQTLYDLPAHRHLARLLSAFCLLDKASMASELVPAVRAALAQASGQLAAEPATPARNPTG